MAESSSVRSIHCVDRVLAKEAGLDIRVRDKEQILSLLIYTTTEGQQYGR